MKMIYIAHPYGGNPENVAKVEAIIKGLVQKWPNVTFYSPLHATGFLYSQISYEQGMKYCLEVLKRCDELWLCPGWEKSTGCKMELAFAKGNHKIINFLVDVGIVNIGELE